MSRKADRRPMGSAQRWYDVPVSRVGDVEEIGEASPQEFRGHGQVAPLGVRSKDRATLARRARPLVRLPSRVGEPAILGPNGIRLAAVRRDAARWCQPCKSADPVSCGARQLLRAGRPAGHRRRPRDPPARLGRRARGRAGLQVSASATSSRSLLPTRTPTISVPRPLSPLARAHGSCAVCPSAPACSGPATPKADATFWFDSECQKPRPVRWSLSQTPRLTV